MIQTHPNIGSCGFVGPCVRQVREDSEVVLDLHTLAKANAEKLGATPEMWSFDSESGKWKLEAADMEIDGVPAENSMRRTAREAETTEVEAPRPRPRKSKKRMKKGDYPTEDYDPDRISASWITPEEFMKILAKEGEKSLAAPVKKLGYWNVDMAYSSPNKAVLLQGTVVDANKKPVPDLQIWANGKDYYGRSPDKSAADGRFSALMVQFDSTVDIEVQQRVRKDVHVAVRNPKDVFDGDSSDCLLVSSTKLKDLKVTMSHYESMSVFCINAG